MEGDSDGYDRDAAAGTGGRRGADRAAARCGTAAARCTRSSETSVSLGTGSGLGDQMGHFEPAAAELLGVNGTTLLAVRPDGYVGLRSDRDHLNALERYRTTVCAGHA
jgi:hypothetical protein